MRRTYFFAVLLVILSALAVMQAQTNTSQPLPIAISQATVGTTNAIVHIPTTSSAVALSSAAISASTTQNVKASAGNLYGVSWANTQAATVWLQFYNTASTPTCGTSVVFSLAVPSSGTLNIPPGAMALHNFSTGIGFCCGTTATGSTACTTGDEAGTVMYF
jgi:hypothetical protein